MKHWIFIIWVFFSYQMSYSQVGFQMTQHYMEPFIQNAAFAGTKPCYSLAGFHHNQWQTIEQAIYSSSISIHKGTNSEGLNSFKNGWHGFGGQIIDDQYADIHTLDLSLAYAYHLKVQEHAAVSFGTFVNLKRTNYDESGVRLMDPNDPAFEERRPVYFFPIISPGFAYYTQSFSVGVSIHNLFKREASSFGNQYGTPADMNTMVLVSATKRFTYYDYYHIIPSLQLRYDGYFPPSVDMQVTWDYDDLFAATLGYRIQDAAIAGFQVRILERWKIGYAYEYNLSRMRYSGQHTHELCITFISCFKNGGMDPRFYCPAYANAQSTNR